MTARTSEATSGSEHIVTSDGTSIAATFYEPAVVAKGAVLIVSAMAVPQTYYGAFARWLAASGYLTATFDYRGMDQSRAGSLRGFRADVLDWAHLDCGAMLDALAARAAGAPLFWIGHSLGGQIIPFVPGHERLAKIITVASGGGYWRQYPLRFRPFGWMLWYVMVPALIAAFGYFPGRRFRTFGDLPKGVMEQWRRWCLDPDYAAGAENARALYARVRAPLVSLSVTDDELMSPAATASLHALYVNAKQTMKRIAPGDAGLARIGHFGFFRSSLGSNLWPAYIAPELDRL